MDNKSRYIEYLKDKENIWLNRFIWHGVNGLGCYRTCNIAKFLTSENIDFNTIIKEEKYKVATLWKDIEKLAKRYVDWCGKTTPAIYNTIFTREAIDKSLEYHFIGSIGEFFFCFLLNSMKSFDLSYNTGEYIKTEFNFSNVTPRFKNEDDFGVDLVGDVEYKNKTNSCVFQVKFWNPSIQTPINHSIGGGNAPMFTNEMASGVYTDGILSGFINPESDKSVFVCWTMKDKNVSMWLKRNAKLNLKMSYIDMDVLHMKIDNKVPMFWKSLADELNSIKSYINLSKSDNC